MEDSIFSFKAAGFLTLVVGLAVFGRWVKVIPFGVTVAAFVFVLVVLHVILGFYYLIEASHFSEETQSTLKWAILVLLLALVVWAKTADDERFRRILSVSRKIGRKTVGAT